MGSTRGCDGWAVAISGFCPERESGFHDDWHERRTREDEGSKRPGRRSGRRPSQQSSNCRFDLDSHGPYATQVLGDLGADVVKIENAGGDIMRLAGQSPVPDMGPVFLHCNRNKKSLELDLGDAQSREALGKLLKTADVFITNVRLSGLQRLGLDYPGVARINPELFTYTVSFWFRWPYAGRQAFDDLVQGRFGTDRTSIDCRRKSRTPFTFPA